MPVTIVPVDGGGVTLSCRGLLTGKELIQAHNQLLASPGLLASCRYGLVDMTAVESVDATAEEVRAMAMQDQRMAILAPPSVPVAVVAPGDVAFGMARMWSVFAEGTRWRIMTFRSRPEADSWIEAELRCGAGRRANHGAGTSS